MKKTWVLWVIAVVATLASAVYQRLTGPTHPIHGSVALGSEHVSYRLGRSHSTLSDQPVAVHAPGRAITGTVAWRRYPTKEQWRVVTMRREGETLTAELPKQPPAGKLEYQVRLRDGAAQVVLPERPAVTRYRGDVPLWVLIPHILTMFSAMLLSARTGLEAITKRGDLRRLATTATVLLGIGGFILGPLVLKLAFNEWWGGFPFGSDLTDNKTLLAGAFWLWALWRLRGGRQARWSVLTASVVTLVIFAIPHSVYGSEIKWDEAPAATAPAGAPMVQPTPELPR